jgi:hypothetical protein
MRSGCLKSCIAAPSRRNSEIGDDLDLGIGTLFAHMFSISSPVTTGTVDLLTLIWNEGKELPSLTLRIWPFSILGALPAFQSIRKSLIITASSGGIWGIPVYLGPQTYSPKTNAKNAR